MDITLIIAGIFSIIFSIAFIRQTLNIAILRRKVDLKFYHERIAQFRALRYIGDSEHKHKAYHILLEAYFFYKHKDGNNSQRSSHEEFQELHEKDFLLIGFKIPEFEREDR